MPLSTLIVDDEPLAREGLRMWLVRDPEVSVVHEAKDAREGVLRLRKERPDLVFLDVQLPGADGFTVLRDARVERMPEVVFVTAHDRYAVQAFEWNALDYLLKPVTEERFGRALRRAKERLRSAPRDDSARRIDGLLETVGEPRRPLERIAVRTSGRTLFLDVNDLDFVRAAENYVELHAGTATHLLQVTLSALEGALDPAVFVRIHRSTIVNATRIVEVESGGHGELTVKLRDGTRLRCSRTCSERVRRLLVNRL